MSPNDHASRRAKALAFARPVSEANVAKRIVICRTALPPYLYNFLGTRLGESDVTFKIGRLIRLTARNT